MGSTIQGRSFEFYHNAWACGKKKNKGDGKAEETSEAKKAADGKDDGKSGDCKGRKVWDITKKVLLALAIAALSVSGVVAIAALVFGLVLMFVPGVGTTIGGALAAISASFGAAIGAAITFLATHATAVVIASSTLLGVTALGAAGLVIATRLCKKKKGDDGDGGSDEELSSSQLNSEQLRKRRAAAEDEGEDKKGRQGRKDRGVDLEGGSLHLGRGRTREGDGKRNKREILSSEDDEGRGTVFSGEGLELGINLGGGAGRLGVKGTKG